MKVNFSERTVTISTSFSFDQMAHIEDLLQTASLEAAEAGNAVKTTELMELADTFGIDIDIDCGEPMPDAIEPLGNDTLTDGQGLDATAV